MKSNFEKGITLVSLVITIIVLIILATVSINIIIGQDGIITKAKQAAQNMEIATLQEQERLNELSGYLSGETTEGGVAYDKIAELNQKYATLKEQYDTLNTEYSNFKTTIATAITDMGVTTAEDADANTMASNIRSLIPFKSSNKEDLYIQPTNDFLDTMQKDYVNDPIVKISKGLNINASCYQASSAMARFTLPTYSSEYNKIIIEYEGSANHNHDFACFISDKIKQNTVNEGSDYYSDCLAYDVKNGVGNYTAELDISNMDKTKTYYLYLSSHIHISVGNYYIANMSVKSIRLSN